MAIEFPAIFFLLPFSFMALFDGVDTMECLPMTLPQPGGLRIQFSGRYRVDHFILIAVDNPKELTPTQTTLLTFAWVTFLTFLAESPGLSTLYFWIQDIVWSVDQKNKLMSIGLCLVCICCFIPGFAMKNGCVISEHKGLAIGVVLQSCDCKTF